MPLYVYGVMAASVAAPACQGIGGEAVELVTHEDVAALVSPVAADALSMGREGLDAHARVLETAHTQDTVLPMRFGVVMADRDEVIERLLAPHRESLLEQLASFAGTVELKVRATYEEQSIMGEVVRENHEIARLREQLRGANRDATYYAQIRLGELVAQALDRKRERDAAQILGALQPLALATDVAPASHEQVVVAASFLVPRGQMGAFDQAVDRIGEAQAGRMRFKYIGPLPPHSFVDLTAAA